MFNATVEVKRAMADGLAALQRQLRDAQSMGGAVGQQLVQQVGRLDADQNKSTFAAEAVPGGGAWPALSEDYARRKRKARPGKKKLVWDGPLRASATLAGDKSRIARVASSALELGTNHPLATIHQFGERGTRYVKPHHRRLATGRGRAQVKGYAQRVNIPARAFIGKSAEQDAKIRAEISRIVIEQIARGAGSRVVRDLRFAAPRANGRLIVVTR